MKKPKLIFIFLALTFLLGAGGLVMDAWRHYKTIQTYPVTAWLEDHKADCGVVLTGGPNRINDALEQLYLKRVKKIIIAGVNPSAELRDIFPAQPFFGDLDPDDIILEKTSLTTYGNAQQSLPLVEALNCKDVVLITSRLHMYRAYETFRFHFPKDLPIYRRSTLGRRYRPEGSQVLYETLKSVFYDFWFF